MSARRRRRPSGHAEEQHNDERWMASYMDMVTVLMCLFLVLFAMSTVDQEKYEQLRNSLATGFGAEESENADTATGVVVPPELVDEEGEGFSNVELARLEVDDLIALRERIRAGLEQQGLAGTVGFELDERGLTVRLTGTETFFEPNSTTLSDVARRVLDTVGPILAGSAHAVSVEGHADQRKATYPFPTNWELSTGRATQVLRHLVENGGYPAPTIAAVGFGDARPLAVGVTPEELALNRRVDIVVLSDEAEAVRALMPEIIAAS